MAGAHAPLSSKPPKEVSSQVQQTHSPDSWHISEDPPFVCGNTLLSQGEEQGKQGSTSEKA